MNKTFSLASKLSYERKGNRNYNGTLANGTPANIESGLNLNYIVLPVLLRASFGKEEKVRVYLNSGPYLGILTSEQNFIKSQIYNRTTISNNYPKFDFGLSAGVGIVVPINHFFSVTLEGRNNVGDINFSRPNSTNIILGINYRLN